MSRTSHLAALTGALVACLLPAAEARAQLCGFSATVDSGFPDLDSPDVKHLPYLVVARERYRPEEGEYGRQSLFVRLSGGAARVNADVRLQGGAEVVRVLATDVALDASDAEWGIVGPGADYRAGEAGRGLEGVDAGEECPDRDEPDVFCVREFVEVEREAVNFWLSTEDGERDELRILIDYPELDYGDLEKRTSIRLVIDQFDDAQPPFWESGWDTAETVGLVVGAPGSGVDGASDQGVVLQTRPSNVIVPLSPLRIVDDRVWFGPQYRLSRRTETVRLQNRWAAGCDLAAVRAETEEFVGRRSNFGPDGLITLTGFPEGTLLGGATAQFDVEVAIPAGQAYGAYQSSLRVADDDVVDADAVDMYVVVVPSIPAEGPCFEPQTRCGEACVDLETNCNHCGACGRACDDPPLCSGGECVRDCPPTRQLCGCSCVDTSESLNHCGGCGRACSFVNASSACLGGVCYFTGCFIGHADVNDDLDDGCECRVTGSEQCNGRDDDCDGETDEEAELLAGGLIGGACGTDVGECTTGVAACVDGGSTCPGETGPRGEACDGLGLDEDCDGLADEGDLCPGDTRCHERICQCLDGRQTRCGSACIDLQSDPAHCGACGNGCVGEEVCLAGSCQVAPCPAGLLRCGSACVDTATSLSHCGACGVICAAPASATASCAAGSCNVFCRAGYVDMNGNPADGCECRLSGDERCNGMDDDCDGETDERAELLAAGIVGGACGNATPPCAPGTEECRGGRVVCEGGTGPAAEACNGADDDCDGRVDDGATCPGDQACEAGACRCPGLLPEDCGAQCVDPGTDPDNCGGCGNRCGDDEVCSGGRCVPRDEPCAAGLTRCGGSCVDLQTHALHCGRCWSQCGPYLHAVGGCEAGACRVRACHDGWADLDGGATPGCECEVRVESCNGEDDDCDGRTDEAADLAPLGFGGPCGTDTGACESGTRRCAGGVDACEGAVGPAAEGCDGTDDDCDGATDEGATCPGDLRCLVGGCRCADPSLTACGDQCIDLSASALHCGRCGRACAADQRCLQGQCARRDEPCPPGTTDCAGACVDLDADPQHCGACGRGCTPRNGVGGCNQGTCTIVGCLPGYVDLDGALATGCECVLVGDGVERCGGGDEDCDGATDEAADLALQGFGRPCRSFPHGCAEGTLRCTLGRAVCEGEVLPAAETCDGQDEDCDGSTDEGARCAGEQRCSAGGCRCPAARPTACGLRCVNTDADPDHCGGCGQLCAAPGACAAGRCEAAGCPAGLASCAGGCADTATSLEHCGGCGQECEPAHATPTCEGGTCRFSCEAGFVDLDGEATPGCECRADGAERCNGQDDDCDGETDGEDELLEAGELGGPCGAPEVGECLPGAVTGCVDGVPSCEGGQGPKGEICNGLDDNCNGAIDDGVTCTGGRVCLNDACACPQARPDWCQPACVALETDAERCGRCDRACADGEVCARGDCLGECPPDLEQCGASCVDPAVDPGNCGACGRDCGVPNASVVCEDGECRTTGCLGWYADRDGLPANGCECRLLQSGVEHCDDGEDDDCDGEIDEDDPRAGQPCDTGGLGACAEGAYECAGSGLTCPPLAPGDPEECDGLDNDCDGETDEEADLAETGLVGDGCGTDEGICQAGVWVCSEGERLCEGGTGPSEEACNGLDDDCDGAVDDAAPCADPLECRDGVCRCADPASEPCAGECVDLDRDRRHCGGCQHACSAEEDCVTGSCSELAGGALSCRCDAGPGSGGGAAGTVWLGLSLVALCASRRRRPLP